VKFAFIVGDAKGPSARHRALCYIPELEDANVDVMVREVPRGWVRRRRFFRSLAEVDLVLVQRRLLKTRDVARLRQHAKRLVFDFDDALPYLVSARGAAESRMRRSRFRAVAKAADLVIAGSEELATMARQVAEDVRIIPTAVDLDTIRPRSEETGAWKPDMTLGWIGSSATLPYLVELRPALEEMGRKQRRMKLRVVADASLVVPGMDVEWKPWHEAEEAQDLVSFDVGLAPLSDDPWARGKCGFRLLQYAAAGVPAVASPVGAQSQILVDGESGWFATTHDEWTDRTMQLVQDRERAREMGLAARRRAEELYGRNRWGPVFRDTLLGLMETR
jgi:glycosyltransferase involved in cell wall biosynthesis